MFAPGTIPAAQIEDNAILTRIFARLPVDMRETFTPDQVVALAQATFEKPTPHAVAIRKIIPLFGGPYYLAVFAGRDRRSKKAAAGIATPRKAKRGKVRLALLAILFAAGLFGLGTTGFNLTRSIAAKHGFDFGPGAAQVQSAFAK